MDDRGIARDTISLLDFLHCRGEPNSATAFTEVGDESLSQTSVVDDAGVR